MPNISDQDKKVSLIEKIRSNKMVLGGILGGALVLLLIGLIAIGFYLGSGYRKNGSIGAEKTLVAMAAAQTLQSYENEPTIEEGESNPTEESSSSETQAVELVTPTPDNLICNLVEFVSDVSIPDDSILEPGESFTKIWRLRNVSDCTWSTEYVFVFKTGAQMGALLEVPLPHEVKPNDTVDISIGMIAPQNPGVYRSDWLFRDNVDNEFGLDGDHVIYVRIIVEEPGTDIEIALTDTGSVGSNGNLENMAIAGEIDDWQIHGFLRFNLSQIPAGATINRAYIVFHDYNMADPDPFEDLGCLEIYAGNFFPLTASDFNSHSSNAIVAEYCELTELNDPQTSDYLIEAIQFYSPDNIDFLLLYDGITDYDDDDSDTMRFFDVRLEINYTVP